MKRTRSLFLALAALVVATSTHARGASPYLPLNLSPHIERQIERVLILAGKPVMRRPIAAAVVLDALPAACRMDRGACEQVQQYLNRYMTRYGVIALDVEGALSSGDSAMVMPNRHGQTIDSSWRLETSAYYQLNDYVLLNAGAVAYDGEITATGSFLSAGFHFAQLDIGFRDHWLSPFSDSALLISTQAPTMPSVTLSNYEPLTPLGLSYEVFLAQMSRQKDIVLNPVEGTTTSGKPRLAGLHLGMEPATGYAIALNRITQYGGGARSGRGLSQFIDALTESQNPVTNAAGQPNEFGNQVASLSASLLVRGGVPFAVRAEYAGEDNAFANGYRLGATNMSLGMDFPVLWKDFDATLEISEWQNAWYVHHLYPRGLTNRGHVLGHWFGDQRVFNNAVGGRSGMVAVGWHRGSNQYLRATYRTMKIDPSWVRDGGVPPYETLHSLGLHLSTAWRDLPVEVELTGGQDIFGDSFVRLSGSIDFAGRAFASSVIEGSAERDDVELFVDVGVNRSKTLYLLAIGVQPDPAERGNGMHLGIGARRSMSKRTDVGMRLELDQVDGNALLSLRALDFQYRVTNRIALGAFGGFARYDYGLPTNGWMWGAGVQFRDVLPKWDIGFDMRHYEKLNRDKSLPSDPVPSSEQHPRLYIDVDSMNFYVSRRW